MGVCWEPSRRRIVGVPPTTKRQRRAPVDQLSALLGRHVQFTYTAWDRIVLCGYLERLQRPENIVYFFRQVVGVPSVTPEVLASRTAPYRARSEERRVGRGGGRGGRGVAERKERVTSKR